MKSRNEVSAGGVVYRRAGEGIEVLIGKDAGYHRWVLPKGLVRKGETFEDAALREVEEEVGVRARIVTRLGEPERYIYTSRGVRIFKAVHYFLMAYESGSETNHDREMEEVRWVPIDDAIGMMGYQGAKDVLARAKAHLSGVSTQTPPDK
ncbi:MAG: NUDIX hydrolase [Chloroflexota bacterium]|nr:MAG: NUDIX hydrolase [Chloroflexota bacterium]